MSTNKEDLDQLRQEMMGGAPDKVLTLQEAAEILRIGRNAALGLVKEPGFPAKKCGKEWRVSRNGLYLWLQGADIADK